MGDEPLKRIGSVSRAGIFRQLLAQFCFNSNQTLRHKEGFGNQKDKNKEADGTWT